MRSLRKRSFAGFLLLISGLLGLQSEAGPQKTPRKENTAQPSSTAKQPPQASDNVNIPPLEPGAIFPAVVARVNGEAIPGRHLEELVLEELRSIGSPAWKDLRGEYRGELTLNKITALINTKLIYQQAIASGIRATDAEVESAFQQFSRGFKSETELKAALASRNMDPGSFRKSIFETLTASKYVETTINKKIVVTAEEAAQYYAANPEEFRHPDVVRISHILIQPEGDAAEQDEAARKRAEDLLARVRKGEDFARLAREHSADASASEGGDIGFSSRDMLAPEYAGTAFSLPVGGLHLARTSFGYHVIKVVDKKKEGMFTLKEVRPRLVEYLKNQKSQEGLNQRVQQLREKARIEILISAAELLNP